VSFFHTSRSTLPASASNIFAQHVSAGFRLSYSHTGGRQAKKLHQVLAAGVTTYDWELLVPARPLAQRLKLVHLEVKMMALDQEQECQTPPWMWPHHCGPRTLLLSQPLYLVKSCHWLK
jgi:hypothetical protein